MTQYMINMREVHEVELSSRCNLACKYCPHPVLERPKTDMQPDVFFATLDLIRHYCDAGTQTEVSLTGIGEAILHPMFDEYLIKLRIVLGEGRPIVLSTNGVAMTPDLAGLLADVSVQVFVSLHRPEVAKPAVDMLREAGAQFAVNAAFAFSAIDWAGQVKVDAPMMRRRDCDYLRKGWGVVRVDGKITTCCMDAHTKYAFGTVYSPPEMLWLTSTKLCETCNLSVPKTVEAELWMEKTKVGGIGVRSH